MDGGLTVKFSQPQRAVLFAASNRFLEDSWRGMVVCRDPGAREVLNGWIADGVELHGWQAPAGYNKENSGRRSELVSRIKAHVEAENEKCGFVLATFLLMVLASWLIHKWLDYIFSNSCYPED